MKREIQEGFLEEAVFEQDVSEWRVREDIRQREMVGKGPKEGSVEGTPGAAVLSTPAPCPRDLEGSCEDETRCCENRENTQRT